MSVIRWHFNDIAELRSVIQPVTEGSVSDEELAAFAVLLRNASIHHNATTVLSRIYLVTGTGSIMVGLTLPLLHAALGSWGNDVYIETLQPLLVIGLGGFFLPLASQYREKRKIIHDAVHHVFAVKEICDLKVRILATTLNALHAKKQVIDMGMETRWSLS